MSRKLIATLVLSGSIISCSPVSQTRSPAAGETPGQTYQRVVAATGHKDIAFLEVPESNGPAVESVAKALGATFGTASLPRSIKDGLLETKRRNLRAYVGGASKSKTEWALREALAASDAGSLAGLVIYTNAPMTAALKHAAARAGAKLLVLEGIY